MRCWETDNREGLVLLGIGEVKKGEDQEGGKDGQIQKDTWRTGGAGLR